MASLTDILLKVTKRLYPTGRAFRIPNNSTIEKIHKALIISECEAYEAATTQTLSSILPDNDNFTEEDAADWERRLAIRSTTGTSLEDRKAAIARKYASPGNVRARQHYLFLEGQLQAAGFDVFVHESRLPDGSTVGINSVIGNQLGTFQLGQVQLGPSLGNLDIVANYIDTDRDNQFVIPQDQRAIFYIGGQVLGQVAEVPAVRREEFRQLILQVKGLHKVGILLINYT